ncbi:hypothetical protein F66182_8626 [Fusarium sp. NRRL 66182]|nr:hypothetical protein F66182_8626 [Fusarium sp. NRRL 66182]
MNIPECQLCTCCQVLAKQIYSSCEDCEFKLHFSSFELSAENGCQLCRILVIGITSNFEGPLNELRSNKEPICLKVKQNGREWFAFYPSSGFKSIRHNTPEKEVASVFITKSSIESMVGQETLQDSHVLYETMKNMSRFGIGGDEPPKFEGAQARRTPRGKAVSKKICDTTTDQGVDELAVLVGQQLKACRAEHSSCVAFEGRRLSSVHALPTRVVYIGTLEDKALRLYIPDADQKDDYIALSYCWGRDDPELKMTAANINDLLKSVPFNTLSKTVQDAVTFTRRLGVRYLWVDALCVIQDEALGETQTTDCQRETARLNQYYQKALCVLAASGSYDSSEGLFLSSDDLLYPTYISMQNGSNPDDEPTSQTWVPHVLSPSDLMSRAPLFSNGWAVQTRLLSPRIIHFTRRCVIWECAELKASECSPKQNIERNDKERDFVGSLRELMMKRDSRELERTWLGFCEVYANARFTKLSDRLPALSGVARSIQAYTGLRYHAGLWEGSITRLLPWFVWRDRSGKLDTKSVVGPSPSWSWASSRGAMGFLETDAALWNHAEFSLDQDLLVHNVNVRHTGRDTDGPVSDGVLTISGQVGVVDLAGQFHQQHSPGANFLYKPGDIYTGLFWDADADESEILCKHLCLRLGFLIPPDETDYSSIVVLVLSPNDIASSEHRRVAFGVINRTAWEGGETNVGLINLV